MSELNDVEVGDWLTIVSTIKGSSFMLRQVTSTTSGLIRTLNFTFRRSDGRAFSTRQKSLTCRRATAAEVEQWLSRDGRQERVQQPEPSEDIVLARHLAAVSVEEWARLGVAQLKKIRAMLEKGKSNRQQSIE